jgi:hypothetical protein
LSKKKLNVFLNSMNCDPGKNNGRDKTASGRVLPYPGIM